MNNRFLDPTSTGGHTRYSRCLLQKQPDDTTEALAAIADEVIDVTRVSAAERTATCSVTDKSIDKLYSIQATTTSGASNLEDRVANIERSLKRIEATLERNGRSRSRSRAVSSRGKRIQSGDNKICWYHAHFAENATKCDEPYNFTPKNTRFGGERSFGRRNRTTQWRERDIH
ncbi:PREDICTED: uncharacterized protein LOC108382376 [Rhagoletis zephyria]|uniref:uncharacterized protein LOC108382376 n=1 Tax=Rhagoletis zephyria TaxID=28612 RepID=UPI0008114D77|nr:PREDICTED: uncharacterized protein LOC108382376 [Rhagoletis zephyria]